MSDAIDVAVVGATGVVGEAMLEMSLPLAFINCERIVGVSEMDDD